MCMVFEGGGDVWWCRRRLEGCWCVWVLGRVEVMCGVGGWRGVGVGG